MSIIIDKEIMIIHNVLNKLFSSPALLSVLRELAARSKGATGREIARISGLTHQAAHNALANLEALKIVKREFAGKAHFFTINREHYLFKYIISDMFASEKQFRDSIYKEIIKAFKGVSESLIVFGSVARKEENVESDLDLCIITDNTKEIDKRLNAFREKLYTNYGITLAPYILKEKEFAALAHKKKSPVNSILKEGIVIAGKSIKELVNG